MASPWFDVEHASVLVTLRAGEETKTFHLSPVALAIHSAYFAARFRADGNEWGPAALEVESIPVAETLLRQCYRADFANIVGLLSDPPDWSEIATFLRTWDMLQMTPYIAAALLRHTNRAIFDKKVSPTEALRDLLGMSETSLKSIRTFDAVLGAAAHATLNSEFEIGTAIGLVPHDLRADVLWLSLRSPSRRNRAKLLPLIADDIRANDRSTLAHLRYLTNRVPAEGYRDGFWITGGVVAARTEAVEILRSIDEREDSPRMRARDAFAAFLVLTIRIDDEDVVDLDRPFPAPKRKRDSSPEPSDPSSESSD